MSTMHYELYFDYITFLSYIRYNIEISGGLGPTVGKVWRIGLMGYNSTEENVEKILSALKQALKHQDRKRARL